MDAGTNRAALGDPRRGTPLGADMIGVVIANELTIERRLAEGGMGAVFVAMQASTGKRRALKLMHREIAGDPDFQRRFVQEAQVGARIQSEHVVDVLSAGVDAKTGLPYLVMELLEGEDLRHRLTRGPISIEETRELLEQVCHAMTAAHAVGVVHRDLKPENLFLQRARRAGAGSITVKVLDFGIAKLLLEASTRATRGTVGSPLWMAPEQTTPGPVTAAADVWAMGLIVYEMLVGKSFWRAGNREDGNTVQLLREIVLEPLPSAHERAKEYGLEGRLPPGFDGWFSRCVTREPAARFQDASAMWRALPPLLASARTTLEATGEALAVTIAASAPTPTPLDADRTGAPTPFVAASGSETANASGGVRPETPIATVHEPPAPPPKSDRRVVIAGGIAVVSIAIAILAVVRAKPEKAPTPAASFVAPPLPSPSPAPSLLPPPPPPLVTPSASATAVIVAEPPPPRTVASAAPTASAPAPRPRPAVTVAGGFSDPSDRNSAVTWKVQDRRVRLLVRLLSNESNVTDGVVRNAIEHASWEYLRCYERAFGAAKELPEATISVSFDILDQLPRHATLVSSTSTSKTLNDCVVGTLLGQTINAAGPDGKGHAVESFRFLPN
jgi:serine/threonine protein kinase